MESLKQWIICIVFCSLIGAVVNILSPGRGTERVMKVVVATFMICAFLSPFISGNSMDSDFVLPEFSYNQSGLSEEIVDSMLSQAERHTADETAMLLQSLDVEYVSVEVEADINHENQIYIKSITVTADKKFDYRERQIDSNLKTMFSAEVIFKWVKS